jgi:hypothetical protein
MFIFNQGKAAARELHVGHYWFPACSVYPDIPRQTVTLPGGGTAIRFPTIPPRTLITISYLVLGNFAVDQIISYVGSEDGVAQRIPVILQRVYPKWLNRFLFGLIILGGWVLLNVCISLIHYLWVTFYK